MKAVGKLHRIGVNRRSRMARPYPAPWTMSSVPYVPPETIKKVAAIRGQSVRRIDFFRGAAVETGWTMLEGAVAVANSDGFLPKRLTLTTASPFTSSRLPGEQRFPGHFGEVSSQL